MGSINKEWLIDRVYQKCLDHEDLEVAAYKRAIEILNMCVGPNDETILHILINYSPPVESPDWMMNKE